MEGAANKPANDAFSVALGLESLVPLIGARDKAEAVGVAREIEAEQRRVFASLPPEDDNHMYEALALCVQGNAELAAGDRAESGRTFDQAVAIANRAIRVPAPLIVSAYTIAKVTQGIRADRLARGNCSEARDWWRKEVELWRGLAPKSEYAALRMAQAEKDAPACGQ